MRRSFSFLYVILLALLAGLVFIQSPGTTDVDIWRNWINNAVANGLVRGYAANQADYPPLADAILYGANQVLDPLGALRFQVIKLSIFFFLLLTVLLYWLWCVRSDRVIGDGGETGRDPGKVMRAAEGALVLYFALFLNSLALGYIDIYFAPGLILSLWMLKDRRWLWSGIFFTLTCLTKWQPVIIAPFIALYLLQVRDPLGFLRRGREPRSATHEEAAREHHPSLLRRSLLFLAPVLVLMGFALLVFGVQPVWLAFRASLSHRYLSGNALNLPWIITHFLHVTRPNDFGALQNGLANYIETDAPGIVLVPRLLFYVTYLAALLVFLRREKSFTNLLLFAIAGFLCYYTFNTGVHENHLFLVAILAVVLMWLRPDWRNPALVLLLMNSVNLFLFYGVDGELHMNRAFLGLDMALPLALFNILFFVYWYAMVMTKQIAR